MLIFQERGCGLIRFRQATKFHEISHCGRQVEDRWKTEKNLCSLKTAKSLKEFLLWWSAGGQQNAEGHV